MRETLADLVVIRSGRTLFVRKVTLQDKEAALPVVQIVFVHGTCATEQQYSKLLQALDELPNWKYRLECLLYDLVGCGQSPALDDWDAYDNQESIQDLEKLIEEYTDSSLPLVIIGHSYAPNLIIPYIINKGKDSSLSNLKACIFLSTAIQTSSAPLVDGGPAIMYLPPFLLDLLIGILSKSFVEKGIHPDQTEVRDLASRNNSHNTAFVVKAYYRHMKFVQPSQLDNALKELPTLIIHAQDDQIIPMQAGQELADLLPHSEFLMLHHSRHLIMLEEPNQVAEAVQRFVERILWIQ